MKLNGCNISISKFTEETVDDEVIIFLEEYRKIIVLNSTAATIWKYILECYNNNKDIDYKDVAEFLKNTFDVFAPNIDELLSDIDDTVNQLYQSSIIVK